MRLRLPTGRRGLVSRLLLRSSSPIKLELRAGVPATLYYRQEFGGSIERDCLGVIYGALMAFPEIRGKRIEELSGVELDLSSVTTESAASAYLDTLTLMQIVWAMAKAGAFPGPWPSFSDWIESLPVDFDYTDVEFLTAALGVAADGLFPRPR